MIIEINDKVVRTSSASNKKIVRLIDITRARESRRSPRARSRALPRWNSQSTKGAFSRAGPQCFSRRVIGSQRKAIRAGIRGEIREHRLAFISENQRR